MDKNAKINEVSITKITIKKENQNDDSIKEFAETAMNELLGWYGYGPREDVARNSSSRACRSHSESNSSSPDSPKFTEVCGWCSKHVEENTALCTAGAVFCSELCFEQSRRATFKKSKTCDWCRHVRHTVSYVDFHDGASLLQFCSDKCLNQYKMHIFCRETQAHLEMHPHLPVEDSSSGTLITPDLWMKNCKSPGTNSTSPPVTPPISVTTTESQPLQTSPLPLITVAHPSKLMAVPQESPELNKNRQSRKFAKRNRKRCPSTITASMNKTLISDLPQDLRVRITPNNFEQPRIPPPTTGAAEIETMISDQNPVESRRDYQTFPHSSQSSRSTSVPNSRKESVEHQTNPVTNSPDRKHFSLLPPPTILVPYPIVLPVPVPIPIPIPLLNFLPKTINNNNNNNNNTENSSNSHNNNKNEKNCLKFVDSYCQTDNVNIVDVETKSNDTNKTETSSNSIINNNSVECSDILDVVRVDEEIIEDNTLPILRPLRKRKKVLDKPKVGIKTKKAVSGTL